jgi:hypothetical protein
VEEKRSVSKSGNEHNEGLLVGYPMDDPVYWVSAGDASPVDMVSEDGEWRLVGPVYLFNDAESAVLMGEREWWSVCPADWPGARPFLEYQLFSAPAEEIAEMTAADAPPPRPIGRERDGAQRPRTAVAGPRRHGHDRAADVAALVALRATIEQVATVLAGAYQVLATARMDSVAANYPSRVNLALDDSTVRARALADDVRELTESLYALTPDR